MFWTFKASTSLTHTCPIGIVNQEELLRESSLGSQIDGWCFRCSSWVTSPDIHKPWFLWMVLSPRLLGIYFNAGVCAFPSLWLFFAVLFYSFQFNLHCADATGENLGGGTSSLPISLARGGGDSERPAGHHAQIPQWVFEGIAGKGRIRGKVQKSICCTSARVQQSAGMDDGRGTERGLRGTDERTN